MKEPEEIFLLELWFPNGGFRHVKTNCIPRQGEQIVLETGENYDQIGLFTVDCVRYRWEEGVGEIEVQLIQPVDLSFSWINGKIVKEST